MIRNKGFFIFAIVISVFALIGSVIISYFDIRAGIAALTFFGLINLSFIVFTKLRYNEIKKLSSYFYKIYTGGDVIDISDNSEGELSVLKGDIYKMTLALQEKNELLKKDRNYLADTLSNISHQLRTPLTSMFMMADFLSDPGLTQEKRDEFLNNLINQLKRIEWLVTSLLKLSKIDANAVEFKKERITAEKLLKKSLAPMMIPIEIKDINLEIAGDKNIEMILDINWTTEAMINIIKNCVEHTSEGGNIKIELKDTAIYSQITVSDNGDGIAPDDAPHIFERFYKGKNAGADSVGIGLAMAKTILNSQGAKLEFKSEEKIGTEFKIRFYKMNV